MAVQHRLRLIVLTAVLLVAVTACGPCSSLSGFRVALPDRPIQISEDAALRFQEKISGGWQTQEAGQFRLQFTDEELTSYLNLRLKETSILPLTEPRIWLTRGDIYVSGNLSAGSLPISGRVGLVLSPQVSDGVAQLTVERASIGPAPIPRALLETLEETLNASLRQAQLNTQIERLQILEGEAIVIASTE